ncbi:kynureninase [Sphaerotilus montanus]|uniref:kynureninase n=1 Tax=Sphaerotilus montanus TaxID=522889 RepID=UPI003FA31517
MTSPITRDTCAALDAADTLAPLRDQFDLPEGVIYLDGNSLGVLPRATAGRVQDVIRREWGQDLIQSWNKAGWIDYPQRVGDKIARLVGGRPGEVIAADSTSLNLYKVLSVALASVRAADPDGQRRVIVSERDNFPTDLYIAESLARQHGFTLRLVETDEIAAQLTGAAGDALAVLMLTHVNYRTGRQHAMADVTAAAHAAGALVVWDLAHSAGAVPVDLNGCDADFAIGCGYKYLNGGPGSPAFLWVHPRHLARLGGNGKDALWQPLAGWMGHAAPFEFTPGYRPAAGVIGFLCGTPSAIALAALECGVDTVLAAEALGGMAAVRAKSLALTDLFSALVAQRCAGHCLTLQTPTEPALRGSQVSLYRDEGAYAIVQALIARGVVGDYRAPGILRFGFTPLYLRFADVWDAVEHLVQVLQTGEWREERFHQRAAVT